MTARPILAVLLGALLGAAAVTLNPLHSAPAPEPQRWEYKVVFCPTWQAGPPNTVPDKLTEQFNDLAKDGWDYAGLVGSTPGQRSRKAGEFLAFRRAKP